MPWQDPPDKSLDKVWEGSCHSILKNVPVPTITIIQSKFSMNFQRYTQCHLGPLDHPNTRSEPM